MPENAGAEQEQEDVAEAATGGESTEEVREQTPEASGAVATPPESGATAGLFETLFGPEKDTPKAPAKGKETSKAEEAKDEKDQKDPKDRDGTRQSEETPPQKRPLSEEWPEGHEFQLGRKRFTIGEDISVEVANAIRRGWLAQSEAQKTKTELARLRQQRTNGTNETHGSNGTDLKEKTAGEVSSGAQTGASTVLEASPAIPSPELAAKRTELEAAVKEELGEEPAKKLMAYLDLTSQAATAELARKNADLEKQLEALKPRVERHSAALSEVEQRQAKQRNLEAMERYVDENPQLREYGADGERMLDLADEAYQGFLKAGYTAESLNTPAGAVAIIQTAEARLMRDFISGLRTRKTGGEMTQAPSRTSQTAPRGAAPLGRNTGNVRDANAQALAMVNGR